MSMAPKSKNIKSFIAHDQHAELMSSKNKEPNTVGLI